MSQEASTDSAHLATRALRPQDRSGHSRVESLAHLELALEAAKMGTWEWRLTDNSVYWSPAVERIHGIPVGSFPGTYEAYQSDMHPDDRDRVRQSIERVLRERVDHELSYRIVLPDGRVRWIQAFGRLICDEQGRPLRLTGVCRDTTEQHQAEEAHTRLIAAEARSAEAERARGELIDVLESITDPFSVYDEELRLTFVNQAAVRLAGRTREEMIGKRPVDLRPELSGSAFVAAYERAVREKAHVVIEDYFPPLDRWFEASIYPLRGGISVYTRDVTEKKKAERLRERLAAYSALRADVNAALAAESEPQAMLQACCEALVRHLGGAFARIWTVDESGAVLNLMASAGAYTHIDGAHARVPIGQFKIGLIAAERAPHLTNDVQDDPRVSNREWARREGMRAFAGYPLLVDDRLLGVLAMFSRDALADDTLTALGGVADTVAQGIARREAERELEARLRDLARSNAELEQFAYVASHDLQEPLRMVASYNQLLARRYRGKLDADADEFIGYTVEGVTRMRNLINDLLTYSRVGTHGREFAPVDLDQAFATAQHNLAHTIADEQAIIVHEPLPTVVGDEGQLVQLFQNLLSNAVKFHSDGAPRVHVSARREGAFCIVTLQDEGIGMEPEYFERVFVIFQRLHPREKYPGTGIGLSICKKIVERHGGKIWIDSRLGAGTTVSFTLPLDGAPSRRNR